MSHQISLDITQALQMKSGCWKFFFMELCYLLAYLLNLLDIRSWLHLLVILRMLSLWDLCRLLLYEWWEPQVITFFLPLCWDGGLQRSRFNCRPVYAWWRMGSVDLSLCQLTPCLCPHSGWDSWDGIWFGYRVGCTNVAITAWHILELADGFSHWTLHQNKTNY